VRATSKVAILFCSVAASASPLRAQVATPNPAPQPPPPRSQQLQRLDDLNDFGLETRVRANEIIPDGQRALIDFGAELSIGYLTTKEGDGENRAERIYSLIGYARVNIDGVQEAFVRGRYEYDDYVEQNQSFDGRGSRENDDKLDRAYYKFDLGRYLQAYQGNTSGSGLSIQGGRDLVYWANGLVLGQRLDGVIVNANAGLLSLQTIAGVTPKYTVDFDYSRPSYETDTNRGFYGGMLTADLGAHHPFIYLLSERDYNDSGPVDISSTGAGPGVTGRFRYDATYLGFGSTGNLGDNLLYSVEAVYEGGSDLTTPVQVQGAAVVNTGPQTSQQIRAGALDARLEYVIPSAYKPRFTLEETIASGDHDRQNSRNTVFGNGPGSDDNAFNAFGLINAGLAFNPNLANLSITRLGASAFPLPSLSLTRRLQLGADLFLYNELARHDAIDESTAGSGRYLGTEPDLYVNWQLTSDLTFTVRYGIFFPTAKLVENSVDRQFFYMGMTYAF
jgi:hypothetical protein